MLAFGGSALLPFGVRFSALRAEKRTPMIMKYIAAAGAMSR
jgi:hypothetical protein